MTDNRGFSDPKSDRLSFCLRNHDAARKSYCQARAKQFLRERVARIVLSYSRVI